MLSIHYLFVLKLCLNSKSIFLFYFWLELRLIQAFPRFLSYNLAQVSR